MKAAFINQYGSDRELQYGEIAQPSPKPDQLLVRVHASSVNPIDWKIRNGMLQLLTGYNFPLVLGFDLAGEVVEVGNNVTRFQPGDRVYAYLSAPSGGAYAEYAAVPSRVACLKPENLSFEEAATVPLAATTALQALRDQGQILHGHKVLINGASGGVGSFAVQIAKAFGTDVTGVCSTKNLDFVKSLGADRAIDYTAEDFTKDVASYDIIFDAVGKSSFSKCQGILRANGIYVTTLPSPDTLLQGILTAFTPGKKAKLVFAQANGQDLAYLKDLIEAEKVRPILARTYLLSEVAAAHRESEGGHVAGKLAISITS
jgi:2-desacetyl-2-hydroxyethyl bacteriochlorophyllide A dehydrogenase